MKNEANGNIITEFCVLRAKLYAFQVHSEKGDQKKAKGVKKNVVKKLMTFEHYPNCNRK